MKTPDFTHLLKRDLVKHLIAKTTMTELEALANAEKLIDKVDQIAYTMTWEKPPGCVCAGPTDPYHSSCTACEERRNTLHPWKCICTVQGGTPYSSGCPIHDHTIDTSDPHWRKTYDDHLEAQRRIKARLGW